MRDLRRQIDDLAALMEEFKLEHASLTLDGLEVAFRRKAKAQVAVTSLPTVETSLEGEEVEELGAPPAPVVAQGQPVSSPMAGIFYLSSSPSSPPFVKEGDTVSAGQTIGLIEAMKVFNEIPSPFAGTVLEILVEGGAVVQPGQVLLRIG